MNLRRLITIGVFASTALMSVSCTTGPKITGNWLSNIPREDGTVRRTYFDLHHDGSKITGSIRSIQFAYNIVESTGGAEGFTLTGNSQGDGPNRPMKFEGKLIGDELHVTATMRRNAPPTEFVAKRVPAGEGALPARTAVPALHKVKANGLGQTPPMGWNSWNKFKNKVDDAAVRGVADAMVKSGMKAAGYIYVNIDDTWQGERDANGVLQPNRKFPDMKGLADYVHSKGLKLGIYSSPGPSTCAGYDGSLGHEVQDANKYAEWGIDFLKYDWCGARLLYKDSDMQGLYQKMGDALAATGRPIFYNLCQYGRADVWKWGPDVSANAWRTTGDIRDSWDSMAKIGFGQEALWQWAAPGHWNDPDMLEIGNGGMTDTEYRTHMSLWSLLAAPLLAGNDVREMSPQTSAILLNREVIAIDQDPAGKQAKRVSQNNDQEVWVKELADGGRAIGLFNKGGEETKIAIRFKDAGISSKVSGMRDLWLHKNVAAKGDSYTAIVPSHGVVLLRTKTS